MLQKGEFGEFKVVITISRRDYNHKLSLGRFESYPKNRMKLSSALVDEVRIFKTSGAPTAAIYRHMMENSESRPKRYDAQNLLFRMKRDAVGSTTVSSRVQAWVREFIQSTGNVARVFHDDSKVNV